MGCWLERKTCFPRECWLHMGNSMNLASRVHTRITRPRAHISISLGSIMSKLIRFFTLSSMVHISWVLSNQFILELSPKSNFIHRNLFIILREDYGLSNKQMQLQLAILVTRPDTQPLVADGWAGAEMRFFSLFNSSATDRWTQGPTDQQNLLQSCVSATKNIPMCDVVASDDTE